VGAPLSSLSVSDDAPGGQLVGLAVRACASETAGTPAGGFLSPPTAVCAAPQLRLSTDAAGGFPTQSAITVPFQLGARSDGGSAGWLVVASLPAPDAVPGTVQQTDLVCTVTVALTGQAGPVVRSVGLPVAVTRAAWPVLADVLVHEGPQDTLLRSARAGGEGVDARSALAEAARALGVPVPADAYASLLNRSDVVQGALATLRLLPPPPSPQQSRGSDDGARFTVAAYGGSRIPLVTAGAHFARFPPGSAVAVGAAVCTMQWVNADGTLAHCRLPARGAAHNTTSPAAPSSLLLPLSVSWPLLAGNSTASSAARLTMSCPPFCPGAPLWPTTNHTAASAATTTTTIGVPVALPAPTPPGGDGGSVDAPALGRALVSGVLVPVYLQQDDAAASSSSSSTLRLATSAQVAAVMASSSGMQLYDACVNATPDTPSPASGVCANASDPRSAACLYGEGAACRPCPAGALCPGGFQLWSRAGSFVATAGAAVAVPCPPPAAERCVGWDAAAGTTRCGAAYRAGSFSCVGCAARHYAAQDGVCEPCPPLTGGSVLAVITTLLAFVAGLAAFVGANYAAIRLIVRWRGGTVRGGFKRSVQLFVWMFGTLQLVAVVCSSAAPGLPPAVRGLVAMLSVFTLESLVPPAACLPGTSPLAMETRVMALALALVVAGWPLASVLAAACARGVAGGDKQLQPPAAAQDGGGAGGSECGASSDEAAQPPPPRSLAARAAALWESLLPAAPVLVFGAVELLYPISTDYALSMLHCRRVDVPLTSYLGMDRGATASALSAGVRALLEGGGGGSSGGGGDSGAAVLSAALSDASVRAALSAPVSVSVLQADPHHACFVGTHAVVGALAACTLVGCVLALPLAAAWLLWLQHRHGGDAASPAPAKTLAVVAAPSDADPFAPSPGGDHDAAPATTPAAPVAAPAAAPPPGGGWWRHPTTAAATACVGHEYEAGRKWVMVVDMGAILVTSLVLVLLKDPTDAPAVGTRLGVTLLVLGGVAGVYALRSPYHPRDPWKLVAKQSSLVLAALGAILSAVQVLRGPDDRGTVALSWITFLTALVVFALITVAFWLALMDGAAREQVALQAAAAVAAAAAAGAPAPEAPPLPPPERLFTASRLPKLFASRVLIAAPPRDADDAAPAAPHLVDVDATTPFSTRNPMMEMAAAQRRLQEEDDDEEAAAHPDEPTASASNAGAVAGEEPLPAAATSIGASGTVRALRSLYQSRHGAPLTSSQSSGRSEVAPLRVAFVAGSRIVRAASSRQIGLAVDKSRRAAFSPSLASKIDE
jgi:hypothetical protein